MTAFLYVIKAASLNLLTDAAWYDEKGVVRHIGSKVYVLPHTRCVITGRGIFGVALVFARFASGLCFDEIVRDFDLIMSYVETTCRRHIGDRFFNHEILIAGWSESRHWPEAFFLRRMACSERGR